MNVFRLLKNAAANVLRIGASTLVMLLLPPFLARAVSNDAYNTWALITQISTYVLFLDFGIQTAVGRFIAYVSETGDQHQHTKIISTAFFFLILSGLVAAIIIGILTWQLPVLFTNIPLSLQTESRLALLIIGGSLIVGLPFSVFIGLFIGLQRNEIPVTIIIVGKLLGALLVVIAVVRGGNLIMMAVMMATANLLSYIAQAVACYWFTGHLHISYRAFSIQSAKELIAYCAGLTIWSIGMLLVSGMDVIIVGFFDFNAVASYTIAATVINFVIQIQSAIFSAMVPAAATLHARCDAHKLGDLLIVATRYGSIILLLMGLPIIMGAHLLLTLWVGASYADQTTLLLQILTIANIIRLFGVPYATLLTATNQQHLVLASPLVEGVVNLIVSIVAAYFIGAIGVAIGTICGSLVGICFHIIYNIPRTTSIMVDRRIFILEGFLRPIACAAPGAFFALAILVLPEGQKNPTLVITMMTIATVSAIFMFWRFGLVAGERQKFVTRVARYVR